MTKLKQQAVKSGSTYWQYERRNGRMYCVGYVLEDGQPVEKHAYPYEGVL